MTFYRLPRTPLGAWLSVSPEKAQVPAMLQGKGESHSGLQRSATVAEWEQADHQRFPATLACILGTFFSACGPER